MPDMQLGTREQEMWVK